MHRVIQTVQKNNGIVIFLPYPSEKMDLHLTLMASKNNLVSKK